MPLNQVERPKSPQLKLFDNYETLCAALAEEIYSEAKSGRLKNIALPTGQSSIELYSQLRKKLREAAPIELTCFNLDEYVSPAALGELSFQAFMKRELFGEFPKLRSLFPSEKAPQEFEESISQCGGIDLCILGIGLNGHIAFNEPGSALESRTRVVRLSESTRQSGLKQFGSLERVPKEAVTMGVATILEARRIVILCNNTKKGEVLQRAKALPSPSKALPISYLWHHKNAEIYACKGFLKP